MVKTKDSIDENESAESKEKDPCELLLDQVMESDLPTPMRHIIHVLAAKADRKTLAVKESQSYADLAGYTGMGKSTVIRHMNKAVELGWVIKTVPTLMASWRDKEANWYQLSLPTGPAPGPVPQRDPSTSPGAGLVPERDPSTGPGAGLVPQGHPSTGPGAGLVPQGHPSTGPVPGLDLSRNGTSLLGKHPPTSPAAGHELQDLRERFQDLREISLGVDHDGQLEPAARLCVRLADLIVARNCLPPKITDSWIIAARALLNEDQPARKIPGADIYATTEELIAWAQGDRFWKGKTLNMASVRTNYDSIADAKEAQTAPPETKSRNGGYVPYRDTKARTGSRWGGRR